VVLFWLNSVTLFVFDKRNQYYASFLRQQENHLRKRAMSKVCSNKKNRKGGKMEKTENEKKEKEKKKMTKKKKKKKTI
jgi:hypothetical protein